jgi:hypothetical protein
MKALNGRYETPAWHGLSAHELAALMLLQHAPVAAEIETLDILALREAGLAERVERRTGGFQFSITRKGKVVLQMLSGLIEPQDDIESSYFRSAPPLLFRDIG